MVRNLVNFAIGFFFLYHILKYVISPSTNEKPPQEIIKKSLITGVLVQMSRFIVMVLVDLSTILIATVSAFPSQLVDNSQQLQTTIVAVKDADKTLKYMTSQAVVYTIDGELTTKLVDLPQRREVPNEKFIDEIMPKPEDLSGPLMRLGFSVFKTNDYLQYNNNNIAGVSCQDKAFKQIFQFILYSAGLVLFTLSLLVLTVVLIVRLAYLWVAIALSPLIIFIKQFEIKGLDQTKEWGFLNVDTIIGLIFQPVKFCFFIGLMMIIIVIYQSFFQLDYKDASFAEGNVRILTTRNGENWYSSTVKIDGLLNMNMSNAKMTIQEIFIAILSLAFMRMIIKVAITNKTGVKKLDQFTSSVAKLGQSTIESTPIIAVPNGSLALWDIYSSQEGRSALLDSRAAGINESLRIKRDEQDEELSRLLWISVNNTGLNEQQKWHLNDVVTKTNGWVEGLENYKKVIIETRKARKIWFSDIDSWLYTILWKTSSNTTAVPLWLAPIGEFVRKNLYGKKSEEIESALQKTDSKTFQIFYRYALDIPETENNIPTSLESYKKNIEKRRLETQS